MTTTALTAADLSTTYGHMTDADGRTWPHYIGARVIIEHGLCYRDAQRDGVDLQDAIAVLRWLGY